MSVISDDLFANKIKQLQALKKEIDAKATTTEIVKEELKKRGIEL